MAPVLEARGITKRFPGVVANDHVDFSLQAAEIHCLLGENGAGKTTLMNILYGLYHQDEGEILVRGQPVRVTGPHQAIALGIGMVHQHFMLIPTLTVTENVMLGVESTRGPFLERESAAQRVRELSRQYGLEVDPDALVRDLSVGIQQRVEIIKALYRQAEILILDEPTAVLTPQEVEDLFEVMRSLARQGKAIIFITHKLREVLKVADRITVLRQGKVVGSTRPAATSQQELATMMVGREVILKVEKGEARPRRAVLELRQLEVLSDRGRPAVRGISLEVRSGEILGVAGVQGNGQSELVEAITGLRPVSAGQILLDGEEVSGRSPRHIEERGTAHVPEDRQGVGLVVAFSVRDNLLLNQYFKPPYRRGAVLQEEVWDRSAEGLVRRFDIRTPSIHASVSSLSGGNQQKVIVAREFSRDTHLVVAAQPTRGLDVGSIEYIHRLLVEKRDQGAAILLVSSELDEILGLSDRIAVLYRGEIMGLLEPQQFSRELLGLLMAGVRPEAA